MTLSSGLFNFLEQPNGVQENSLLPVYWFIIKGYGKGYRGVCSGDRLHRVRCMGRVRNFLCQSAGVRSPAPVGIHQPGSSPNSCFGVLWSLHHVDMISY